MLLEINFTLVLFAVSFLIFVYLLNLMLYKPVGEIIEKRKNLIEGEYKMARILSEDANKALESYKNQIKQARLEAQNIIQSSISEAQKLKEEKIQKLMSQLIKEKEIAIKQIEKEKEITNSELKGKIKILTEFIINKVLSIGGKTLVKSI